jgi:hypothetical protein
MANVTNTKTLPPEVQERYEIVGELEGGPRFDIPRVGMYNVDFSKITLDQAAFLVQRKWKHIRAKVLTAPVKASAPVKE